MADESPGGAYPALDATPDGRTYLQSLHFEPSRRYAQALWGSLWTGAPDPPCPPLAWQDQTAIQRTLRAQAAACGWVDPDPAWETTRIHTAARDCWTYLATLREGQQFARRLYDYHFYGAPYPGMNTGSTVQNRVDAALKDRAGGVPIGNYAALLAPDFVPVPDPNPVPAVAGALLTGPRPAAGTLQRTLWQQLRQLRTWLGDRPAADQPFADALYAFYFTTPQSATAPLPVPTNSYQLDIVTGLHNAWQSAATLVAGIALTRQDIEDAYEAARAARDAEVAAAQAAYPTDPARWRATPETLAALSAAMDTYAALTAPRR